MNRLSRLLPPALLIAALGWVYASTLAPGLTWANGGADGGDLIAATATGGVPHPTGYPVYLLLAGLFQHLPVGPPAFRANLLSALASLGAALLVYGLVTRFLADSPAWTSRLAGLASAFAFALAPLAWSQAVIAEVYALHALFVAAILYLSSGPVPRLAPKRLDLLLGLVFGLALGNHVTSIFLLPVVFLPVVKDPRSLARRASGLALGLASYLILPLRALSHPPINWGNPVTLHKFFWLVSGRLYQDDLLAVTWAGVWERTQSAAALTLAQFGVVGLILGVMGLIVFFSRSRLYANAIWTASAFAVFAVAYGVRDSQVHLIPAFLCFSIWIGVALARLSSGTKPARAVAVFALFAAYLIFLGAQTWPQVDASQDRRAEEFGRAVLGEVPDSAILLVKGDEAVFALWYFHFALGERPHAAVVAADLLHHDWYQQSLRDAYPWMDVPGPFPFPETIRLANPSRPACYVEYDGEAVIECFPPAE